MAGGAGLDRARRQLAAGDPVAAEADLAAHLKAHPDDAAAWRLRADAARDLGRPGAEIAALERALAAGPADGALWHRLGRARFEAGRVDAAETALRRALSLAPEDARAHEHLARVLLAREDLPALDRLQAILDARFGDRPVTHLVAGHAAKARGDAVGAGDRYRRALDLAPDSGEALWNLADLEPLAPDDPVARRLAVLAGRTDLPVADRVNVAFARGRVHERAGDADAAFEAYRAGNALARATLAGRGRGHDRAAHAARIDAVIRRHPVGGFERPLGPSPVALTPIFVVGLPRSGTTLVEQILASHPDVVAGGELTLAPALEARALAGLDADATLDAGAAAVRARLEDARERYLEGLLERDLDARWVVDKLPANAERAGFLRLLFPDAPIVHCRRDPRATAWSLFAANFAAHEAWIHDLDDMAEVFRQHERLMAHWRSALPGPFTEVVHETLVRSPERTIRALADAIALPFDPAMLAPHELDRPVFTASHGAVRRPIDGAAAERWRPQADRLRAFEALAGRD